MKITKLILKNIRSHTDASIDFTDGINSISGKNGAGKSTIIESIGLCVFNSDATLKSSIKLADYFLSYGRSKGLIQTHFEIDGEQFIMKCVITKSGKKRALCDENGDEITECRGDVDIDAFLASAINSQQQPDTLFSNVIGARQGTFCDPFLLSGSERSKAFNKILGVDSYAQARDKAGDVKKCFEAAINELRVTAAKCELQAERVPVLKAQTAAAEAELTSLEARLIGAQNDYNVCVEQKQAHEAKRTAAVNAENDAHSAEKLVVALKSSCQAAKQRLNDALLAADRAAALLPGYERYSAAQTALDALEKRRMERDSRLRELTALENDYTRDSAGITAKIQSESSDAQRLSREREGLAAELETLRAGLSDAELSARLAEYAAIEAQQRLQSANEARVKAEKSEFVQNRESALLRIAELNAKRTELTRQLKKLECGECPYTNERCDKLRQLSEGTEQQIQSIDDELALCKKAVLTADAQITAHIKALDAEKNNAAAEFERSGAQSRQSSEALGLLHQRIESAQTALERSLNEQNKRSDRITALNTEQAQLENVRLSLVDARQALCEFDGLDDAFAAKKNEQQSLLPARDEYVGASKQAAAAEALKTEFERLEHEQAEKQSLFNAAQLTLERARLEYNEKEYANVLERFSALSERIGALKAEQSEKKKQLVIQRNDLLACEAALEQYDACQTKLEKQRYALEQTKQCVEILGRAGERLGEAYRKSVGARAAGIYRAVMSDAADHVELVWHDNYGILLRDSFKGAPRERVFRQLSGGEQMAAALSVRLALLTLLSRAKLAFFDEPTAGLDAAHRESLANLLPSVTHRFDQVFVVSHDDTFEAVTENTVAL